jgi:hypothetical protein
MCSSLLTTMRIQYKVDGGIAYLPDLYQPVTVDTDNLPREEANKLERLIEAADFFDLPAVSSPPRGAADYFQYTISITGPERSHTVRVTDPIADPHLRTLIDYLEEKARESRAAP